MTPTLILDLDSLDLDLDLDPTGFLLAACVGGQKLKVLSEMVLMFCFGAEDEPSTFMITDLDIDLLGLSYPVVITLGL